MDKEQGYYNEDLSRKAVGRLFNESVTVEGDEKPPEKPIITVKQALSEVGAEQQEKDYIDYINQTSKRHASKLDGETPREGAARARREMVHEFARPDDEDDGDSERESAISVGGLDLRFLLAGASVLVLIILVFLIVNINSAKSQLKAANEELAAAKLQSADYETLKIEKNELQTKNSELTAENNRLKIEVADLSIALNTADKQPTTAGTSGATTSGSTQTTPNTTTGTQQGRTYTVARGDTVWGIAVQFYNDGSKYKSILTANNLQENSVLQEGMKLIIP